MRHFIIVGLLVVLATVAAYAGIVASDLMPVQASAQSVAVDWMWDLQMKIISFLFALIVVPMGYSLVVFRQKKGETADGEHFHDAPTLEMAWTVIPLFVVLFLAYLSAENLGDVLRKDPNALPVRVIGSQWNWAFEYPDYGVKSDVLYLPVDKQAYFKMEARDVIHSFWVPEFRLKQDLVPGRVTELRITPSLVGDYKVRCAELCGTGHSLMEQKVVVLSQADFDAWIAQKQLESVAATTPAERGAQLYKSIGCAGCHTVDGTANGIAPTWKGLFGSSVELADGSKVTADEAYITESIKNPKNQIVYGFSAMSFDTSTLTSDQISDLVAFILSLK